MPNVKQQICWMHKRKDSHILKLFDILQGGHLDAKHWKVLHKNQLIKNWYNLVRNGFKQMDKAE